MKVCFVADLPTGRDGAELQCYLIARGLSSTGWSVTYVVLNKAIRKETAFPVYHARTMFPGNGWLARYSRFLSLFRFLNLADPDVLFVTHGGSLSGFVTCYALLRGKKIVFRAATRADADFTLGRSRHFEERGLVAQLLHLLTALNAHAIITNCTDVANAFRKRFPRHDVWMIPNGLPIESVRQREAVHILWIAKLIKVKNPGAFVRLAKELPHIRFVMCGSGPLAHKIGEQAGALPNLNLVLGGNEREKRRLLETAFAFVSTSLSESFPNTLIEAGIYRLPYVSFVDPEEVICRYKLGFHVRSFRELVEATQRLVRNGEVRAEMGDNIRAYVQKQHDIRKTVAEYDRMLRYIISQP